MCIVETVDCDTCSIGLPNIIRLCKKGKHGMICIDTQKSAMENTTISVIKNGQTMTYLDTMRFMFVRKTAVICDYCLESSSEYEIVPDQIPEN